MPLRSRTQASSVSMIRDSMTLSTSRGGMAMPVPASTARASDMKNPPSERLLNRLLRLDQSGPGADDVKHRPVALLDEAIEPGRPPGVEARRRVGGVGPDFEGRSVRDRGHRELHLRGLAVDDVDGAAVGAAAEQAGLAVQAVRFRRAGVEGLLDGIAGLVRR